MLNTRPNALTGGGVAPGTIAVGRGGAARVGGIPVDAVGAARAARVGGGMALVVELIHAAVMVAEEGVVQVHPVAAGAQASHVRRAFRCGLILSRLKIV